MRIPFLPNKKPKSIGLALGGGAARGIAHLGVIKRLREYNIPISCIAGTSAGSLVGGTVATGIDLDYLIHHVKKMKWLDIVSFRFSKTGLISSKKLDRYMGRLIGSVCFKDLKTPFTALSTNILTGEAVELNEPDMPVSNAIRASSSFPGVYPPFEWKGQYLIDGGASSNIPIDTVRNMGADYVIGVDVIPVCNINEVPKNMALIVDRGLDLLLHRQRMTLDADLMLHPVTAPISSFDMKYADQLIQMGMNAVDKHYKTLRDLVE